MERPKLIPFTETIPKTEQIKGFRETYLMPELSGLLGVGCAGLSVLEEGWAASPQRGQVATQGSPATRWTYWPTSLMSRPVFTNPSYTGLGRDLHEAYLKAIDLDKDAHLGQRKFYQRLRERGFTSYIGHGNATYWHGVGLKTNQHADPDNPSSDG